MAFLFDLCLLWQWKNHSNQGVCRIVSLSIPLYQLQIKRATPCFCKVELNSKMKRYLDQFKVIEIEIIWIFILFYCIWRLCQPLCLIVLPVLATIICFFVCFFKQLYVAHCALSMLGKYISLGEKDFNYLTFVALSFPTKSI